MQEREPRKNVRHAGSCEQLQATDTEARGREEVGQEDQAKEHHTLSLVRRRRTQQKGAAEEGLTKTKAATVNTHRELPSKNLSKEPRRQSLC